MQIALRIFLLALLQTSPTWQVTDPLGKSLKQVIVLRGSGYKKIRDASGHQGLLYKRSIPGIARHDTVSVSELLYFEKDTCYKDISILPDSLMDCYMDSFNAHFQQAGSRAWLRNDSSFLTIALRDGFLDITSFTAGYVKNPH